MTAFEQYAQDHGWRFKTEDDLKAGFDRLLDCASGNLVTVTGFIDEVGEGFEVETLKAVYKKLIDLVAQERIPAREVYMFARFKWCLRSPEAIIAYQTGISKWSVNNCDMQVPETAAIVAVNREWGFEASRVQIIGTPYYEATDWQFIRFDCAHMSWLWKDGSLYQVIE